MTDPQINSAHLQGLRTPLYSVHVGLGARMVSFAGYQMPVQYTDGIIAEHLHTRADAGIFDVSHMGQAYLVGQDHAGLAGVLEALTPAEILELVPGQQRYTQLLNRTGGIIDDLMVSRPADSRDERLLLVVNAARKEIVFSHIEENLPLGVRLVRLDQHALLALQGPTAVSVLERSVPEVGRMPFMTAITGQFDGVACGISRSGYTGEDGFELSVPAVDAERIFKRLIESPEVRPVGLGARDTLRLEAGLCLYGHDIDDTTSPVEAALTWSVGKRRRANGGFPGYKRVQSELATGPSRKRVGILPADRVPAREGTKILSQTNGIAGTVTSGSYSPTLRRPIAMGYVENSLAPAGNSIDLVVRNKKLAAAVAPIPFVPHRYFRGRKMS